MFEFFCHLLYSKQFYRFLLLVNYVYGFSLFVSIFELLYSYLKNSSFFDTFLCYHNNYFLKLLFPCQFYLLLSSLCSHQTCVLVDYALSDSFCLFTSSSYSFLLGYIFGCKPTNCFIVFLLNLPFIK